MMTVPYRAACLAALALVPLAISCGTEPVTARGAATSGITCPCQIDLAPPASGGATFWVQASDLMPAWGYVKNGAGDPRRVPNRHAYVTWVVSLPPATATPRRVFARSSHGQASALIDDLPLDPPIGGASLPPEWTELGTVPATIGGGPHHLDVEPGLSTALEVVLITTDGPPAGGVLRPEDRVTAPVTRYPRLHRLAFPPRAAGGPPTERWALGNAERFDEDFTNWHPFGHPSLPGAPSLTLTGARNQVVAGALTFAFRGSPNLTNENIRIEATPLVRENDVTTIPAERIDLRVAVVQPDTTAVGQWEARRPVARLLAKDDRACEPGNEWNLKDPSSFALCPTPTKPRRLAGDQSNEGAGPRPAHTWVNDRAQRQIWVTVDPSGLAATGTETPPPAGRYHGTLSLVSEDGGGDRWDVPLTVELEPFELPAAPGWNGVFYNRCFSEGSDAAPNNACSDEPSTFPRAWIVRERRDQRAHGMTAFLSRDSFLGIDEAVEGGFGDAEHRKVMIAADPTVPVGTLGSYASVLASHRAAGWEVIRFICDEPEPPSDGPLAGESGCNAILQASDPATPNGVIARLATIADADEAAAISLNKPGTVTALVPHFNHAIISITTADLSSLVPLVSAQPPTASRRHLAYWVADVSYPIYHRALAGRFTRTIGPTSAPSVPTLTPSFDGIFVNSYDQRFPSGFTLRDDVGFSVPTAGWEALREGIDDARYHRALSERRDMIEKVRFNTPAGAYRDRLDAAALFADSTLEAHDREVRGPWHNNEYLSFLPWLDARGETPASPMRFEATRRAYAEAIRRVDDALASGP